MIKRLNKKGDAVESFSVNWIYAIIFLIVIVIGLYLVVKYVGQTGKNIPQQEEVIVQFCSAFNPAELATSYCLQPRQIKTNEYITCDYADKYGLVINDAANKKLVCDKISITTKAIRFKEECTKMKLKITDKIDQITCEEWTKAVNGQTKGELVTKCGTANTLLEGTVCTASGYKLEWTSTSTDDKKTYVCCSKMEVNVGTKSCSSLGGTWLEEGEACSGTDKTSSVSDSTDQEGKGLQICCVA